MKDQKKWVCNSCNARNSITHSFCIKCGTQRPVGELCPKCGAHLSADQQFCFYCGTPTKHANLVVSQYPIVTNEKHTEKDVFIRKRRMHKNTDQASPCCAKCGKPINGEASICEQCKAKKRTTSLWMRSVAAVLVVALLSGIAVHFVGNRTPKVKNAEQAISVLKDLGEEFGYENAFSELTEKNTTTIDGDSYFRLQQNYRGIPVYGKTVVYSADDTGKTMTINGNVDDIKSSIDLTATVTKDQIVKSIQSSSDEFALSENDIRELLSDLNSDDLCIYVAEDGTESLAYVIDTGCVEYVVDAKEGTLLLSNDLIRFNAKESTVQGDLFGQQKLHKDVTYTKKSDAYILRDINRKIHGYLAINDKSFSWTYFKQIEKLSDFKEVQWSGYNSPDPSAVDAYVNAQIVYNFFEKKLLNSSTDGSHKAIIEVVTGGKYFDNNDSMIGNAFSTSYNLDGQLYTTLYFGVGKGKKDDLSAYLDVVAHEYMHGVEKLHSNMVYVGESGAIMEGLSDIFGELVEWWHMQDEPDWHHNNRCIYSPQNTNNPSVYKGEYWDNTYITFLDKGGVHNNSTVISHAAYLMANGIEGNTKKKIELDELAELWYRAMLMMPSDCDFSKCRQMVEWAALCVDGITEAQRECIDEAFDRVGIELPEQSSELLMNCDQNIRSNSELKVYDAMRNLHTGYQLHIEGTIADDEIAIGGNILTDIGFKYDKTITVNNRPHLLKLPNGYYTFAITDRAYPNYTYSFTVSVNDQNAQDELELYTDFGTLVVRITDPTEAPARDNVLSGKCGDNLTWTLENGVLTISGTGAMYDYDPFGLSTDTSAMPAPWYDYAYNNEVTAIQIGDGVTYIGSYAFACCWNIDNIRIPGNVKQIGEHAFHACSSTPEKKLNVVIENGVEIIGNGAFFECFAMNLVDLPDSITYIGDAAFWNCRLTSITIPKNVTYIGSQVFYGVSSNTLKNVYFTGNAPQFADDTFLEEHLTVYYPGSNTTWTRSVMRDYGGHINWVKEHKPITLGSFKNLSEAYTYAINSKPNDMFSYGMLEDIDGDGTDELILGYCDSIAVDGTEWAAHCYSIYDYKNEKLICSVDKEVICYEVAGNSGRIGVVYYKNKPTLMRKEWEAPHGTSGDLFENYYTLYDPEKYQPLTELRVDQHNEGNIWYEYYVDHSEVTQAEFEDELKNCKYLALNSDGRVDYSYSEKSFDELKEYLDSLVVPQIGLELAAYKSIVEKAKKTSDYNDYYFCKGILIDLDNDNVQELVLRYLSVPFEEMWWSEHKLSVYDYENGKVITKLDGVTFGEMGGAGADAYATILYKSGKPYIMTYNDFGETSSGGSMKPNRVGMMTIYDGKTCKEAGVYRIERWDNVMSYQINQRTVSEKEFVSEIEQYQGVEVICDLYQLIEFPETFVTVSNLLQKMK